VTYTLSGNQWYYTGFSQHSIRFHYPGDGLDIAGYNFTLEAKQVFKSFHPLDYIARSIKECDNYFKGTLSLFYLTQEYLETGEVRIYTPGGYYVIEATDIKYVSNS
jgi:hypothetical protein